MRTTFLPSAAAAVLALFILSGCPVPVTMANKAAFSDPEPAEYKGFGTLHVCTAEGDIPVSGKNIVFHDAPVDSTGRERTVLAYTPAVQQPKKSYPVLWLLHGFAARPSFWVTNLIPVIDNAIESGVLPPLVVIMPDGTLGGNGLDDPDTECDERGGCWYIDSNRVRYEGFLLQDLPEFISTFAVLDSAPERNVIAGSSMGGCAAARYSILYPQRFSHAALFYPALDLRYSIYGKPLAEYDPAGYKPIADDKPRRVINRASGGGILGLTERWALYPVFDSDSFSGEVWTKDLPVWQRVRDHNPTDILRGTEVKNLEDSSFFILVGNRDDFNFDDHLPVFLPLLEQTGASIEPENHIVEGGRHNWHAIEPSLDLFIGWLNECLTEQQSGKNR